VVSGYSSRRAVQAQHAQDRWRQHRRVGDGAVCRCWAAWEQMLEQARARRGLDAQRAGVGGPSKRTAACGAERRRWAVVAQGLAGAERAETLSGRPQRARVGAGAWTSAELKA
jgi:hypothetical protein